LYLYYNELYSKGIEMPDTANQEANQDAQNTDATNTQNQESTDTQNEDPVQKLVKEKVAEALRDIKTKLDGAYSARDEALRKVAEAEKLKKEADIQRLKDEGKEKEALEIQLSEERARREVSERRNIELTRDLELRNTLSSYDFRNENATEMAYREVVTQLVQNEQGIWVHKSGVSVKEFVKQFTENEANSFLLKPKVSTGSGNSGAKTGDISSTEKKSLFGMSQEEVLKLAREGKLPKK
jgi:hypothetical protein